MHFFIIFGYHINAGIHYVIQHFLHRILFTSFQQKELYISQIILKNAGCLGYTMKCCVSVFSFFPHVYRIFRMFPRFPHVSAFSTCFRFYCIYPWLFEIAGAIVGNPSLISETDFQNTVQSKTVKVFFFSFFYIHTKGWSAKIRGGGIVQDILGHSLPLLI